MKDMIWMRGVDKLPIMKNRSGNDLRNEVKAKRFANALVEGRLREIYMHMKARQADL